MKSTIKFLLFTALFTSKVISQVPSYVPTSGLVGYWPFNGNANDESGNNLNGTLIGSPQLSIDRFGNNNQAYDFNYSNAVFSQQNQEIYIPYNSILDVNNITVSYWIFPRSYYWSGNPNLTVNISRFQYGYSNPNGQVWGIGFTDTQVMGGLNGPQGGGDYSASYNSPITLNTWNNIVLTFDGTNIELFLNGNLVATTPHALAMNTLGNSGISIGENNSANGYWQYTDGIMDDIGIWNRALTQQEITNLYTSTVPVSCLPAYVPTSGLVGYWPFCGNANDESGNGNNGANNGATLTTDRNGNANSAYSFDGVNDFISNPTNGLPYGNTNRTVNCWIRKENNNSPWTHTAVSYGSSSQSNALMLGVGNNNNIVVQGWGDDIGTNFNNISYEWHMMTFTLNQGLGSVYYDGVLVASQAVIQWNTIQSSFYFGSRCDLLNSYFFGQLDDIGIWNRALTPQEITNLYTSTVPPSVAVLSGDATICAGASTNLSVAVTGGTAPYTVTVTDGTNNYSATGASPVSIAVSPTATSTYSIVSVTGGGTGTGNTGTATVTVIDATITASDSVICAGDSVTLSVPQGGSSNTACAALPTNLQTGLVGYWPFCGNANDESGNGNNGNLENGVQISTDRFSNANSAYDFDGNDDRITVPHSASISPQNFVTVSTWIYPRAYENGKFVLAKGSHVNLYYRSFEILAPDPNQKVEFRLCNGSQELGVFSSSSIPLYQWTNITCVYNGNQIRMYVNGVLENTQAISGGINQNTEPLTFGGHIYYDYSDYWFDGKVDDVAIFNRVLSQQEILDLYNQNSNSYAWSTGATTPTISVSPTTTTTYTCTTTTNGVSCTDSVTVVVNNPIINLGSDVTACGTSTTLTAPTGFDSYLWSNGATTNTTTVSANGTYSCTVSQGGCSASDTLEVVLITLNAQASSTSICAGASVVLTGSSNLNLNQNSYCIGNTGSPNPWPYPSAFDAGIIDLGNIGAQNVFSISAWVNAGATQNGISILLDASHGGSANWVVQAFGNNTYTWGSLSFTLSPNVWQHVLLTYVNGSKKCYIDGQLVASVFNPISYSGSPELYLGNWPEGGRRFNGLVDELYITYSELESANFTPSQVVNSPSSNSFGLWHFDEGSNGTSVNSVNGSAAQIGSWFWATRPIVSNATISWNGVPGASVQTVSPQITTTYVSSVTMNSVTCSDSVTVVVNNPIINLGSDVTVCGTSTTLTAPAGFDSYLWSNGGTTNTTTVSANGTYSCAVTQGGCSASDSIDVTLIDATISASDSVICPGDSVTLSVSQGGSSNTACAELPINLQTGLVGYWPFCGNANDESGNGNNGTVNGATLTTDRFGSANSAYSFDGGSAFISLSAAFFNGSTSVSSMSYSTWVNINSLPANGTRFAISNKEGYWRTIGLSINSDGSFSFGGSQPSPQGYFGISSQPNSISSNTWSLLSVTFSNGVLKLYKDGVQVATTTASYSQLNYSYLQLGNSTSTNHFGAAQPVSPGLTAFFNGTIDEFATWNRELTASEIQQLYALGQTTYLWSNGGTTSIINISPTSTTTYTCTVTTNGVSCTDSMTVVLNNPTIDLGSDVTACGTSTTLTAPAGFDSYVWSNGATTNTTTVSANGTYTCTVKLGLCSATDSIDVVLVPLTTNTSSASACDSYLWNGTTYTTSGAYTGTTTNCVTESLNLTITPSSTNTTTESACDSYSWNGTTYTTSGVYTGTTANCVTQSLNLTITPSSINTTPISACDSYSWNGTTYTATGVYTGTTANCVTQSLNLTITPSSTNTTPISACNSYVWNGTSYTSSGVYSGTTTNCVTESLNLTITPSSTNTTPISACDSYSWNGTTYTASGVYTGTTTNCVTQSLNLTITPSSTNTTTITACNSYTWNGTTYTASGVYTGTTANCVTQSLNLTITPSSTNTTTAAACNSYTWNGTSYTASGVYTGTTTNCVTQSLNLTITPSSTYTISVSACGTYTWPNNGQTYTTSGVYIGTTANCVTQSLNLTITPNTSVTTTINANDTYTWAANGITYTASGIYTGPTSANCVTQYLNLTINSSGISEEELVLFSLYPNPVSDMLYVNLNGQDKQDYLIIDNFGAVIKRGVLGNLINEISVSQLSSGLYYFKIEGTKPRKFSKID